MINYPFGIKTNDNSNTRNPLKDKNKGLSLESLINESNEYYLNNDIALIYKKPTPIQVVKINKENIITEAYFKVKSTTDYNGLYKGKYIDFEAKETTSKSSFPLSNIKSHQLNHLESVSRHGGIAFLIIAFTSLNEFYIYSFNSLEKYLKENKSKSIPLKEIRLNGYLIELTISPKLDYLKFLDLFM